jgi:hypothetical protein
MATQTIKDDRFRVIGYIESETSGRQVAKDARFRIVGYYDPKMNATKDDHFRIVGYGNLLSSLIRDCN